MKAPSKTEHARWNMPDREWLEHQRLTLRKSYKQIAREVGCDKSTVQSWARKLEVSVKHLFSKDKAHPPIRIGEGSGARFYGVTKEWLEREYVELDKSAKQIADEVGTSHHAVCNWIKKRNIPARTRDERNERHSRQMSGSGNPAWDGGTARNYQYRLLVKSGRSQLCSWCRTTEDLQVHHIDHDKSNGSLENLTWLCGLCNRMESNMWGLQKLGRAKVRWEGREQTITYVT